MVFEHIEELKREYTDKYVIVNLERPELRRFEGQTGMVKTINMNGNALVEFDGLNNIGWYDISLQHLEIVDKPLPKEEPEKKPAVKKPAAKPAAKKEAKAAPKPAAGGGMSVADMLAAARGEKGGSAAPAKEEPAAAPAAEKAAAPASGGAMSVADMLAAARAEKSGGGDAPAAEPEAAEPEPAPAPVAAAEPEPEPEPEAVAPAGGDLPTETDDILAYCRKVDA